MERLVKAVGLHSLFSTALRATFREGYGLAALRQDVLAGLVVAMVALPLAMALGVGVGVAPQYGLYTAIVAGFIVAALGGSRTQVSGPTAAFIVILASVQAKYGFGGLLMAGMLSGFVLMGMGAMRLGRFITFVPHPVTTGFTAGIATVIAFLQLKDLFGLVPTSNPDVFLKRVVSLFDARHTFSLAELSIGVFTFLVLRYAPRLTTKIPSPLLALPLAAVVAVIAHALWPSFSVATIASRFHSEHASGIPQLPPLPMLPWMQLGAGGEPFSMTFDGLRDISSSAFAIAALAAMESLLSATIADGLTRTKHDPNGELMALGVANVITPFFGGIAATGAIARTATNIRSGARSPVAAMVHALALLVAVLTIAPLLGYLPMAALAALLLIVAINMSEARHFVHIVRVAPKSDVVVLLTCYILTVGIDMVVGVSVGMVLSAFLFMRRMAEVTQADLSDGSEPALKAPLPPGVAIYTISGPLFFGAAQRAIEVLSVIGSTTKVVILDLTEMGAIDMTGLVALESALTNLRSRGCRVFFAGVRSQPLSVLMRAGILARLDVQVAGKLDDAVQRAAETIATLDPLPAQN